MKPIFLCLIVFSCLINPARAQSTSFRNADFKAHLSSGSITGSKSALPYTEQEGLILIPVIIDGKVHNFLFDTGAEICLISDKFVTTTEVIDSVSVTDNSGAATTLQGYRVARKNISIGNYTFRNITCVVKDLSQLNEIGCVQIDGIIGQSAIQLCNWMVDPAQGQITLQQKPFRKERKSFQEYDITTTYRALPLVNMGFGDVHFWALLDSGYQGYVLLNDSVYFNNKKSSTLPLASGAGKNFLTINNTINNNVHWTELDSIWLGSSPFYHIPAIINGSKPLLGAKFLRNFVTIYNPKKKKLYLKQYDNIPKNSLKSIIGFGFKLLPDSNKGFIVSFLWENSPAINEGIMIGDKVLSINGNPLNNNKSYCDLEDELKHLSILKVTVEHSNGKRQTYVLNK